MSGIAIPVYVGVMALVTYAVRMVPFVVFRKKLKSKFLKDFLYYVPYAVLGAMTFPDVLYATGNLWTALAGLVVAVLMAWRGWSLLTVAVGACLAVAAAQGVMMVL